MAAQQPLDGFGGVDMGLPVRAINRSDQVVVWEYARAKHVLQPGVPTFVPYMAMVYWQGDPRAIDLPGGRKHEQHRRQGREQLRVLYGVYENEEKWEQIPLVECYPIDSDVRFETILHDPEGHSLAPQSEDAGQASQMRQQLEQMASQMRAMQAQLHMQEQQEAAADAAGVDLTELDRQETQHRTVSPEEATGQSMVGPTPQRRIPVPKGPAVSAGGGVARDGE